LCQWHRFYVVGQHTQRQGLNGWARFLSSGAVDYDARKIADLWVRHSFALGSLSIRACWLRRTCVLIRFVLTSGPIVPGSSVIMCREPVLSPESRTEWRRRIVAAASRYEDAKRRVEETTVERLVLPSPDGNLAHARALQDERRALKEYTQIMRDFADAVGDS
jgi:hypothetical protein